jgi:hypothetical protein
VIAHLLELRHPRHVPRLPVAPAPWGEIPRGRCAVAVARARWRGPGPGALGPGPSAGGRTSATMKVLFARLQSKRQNRRRFSNLCA